MTSQNVNANNLEKSRLVCILDIFCTFLDKNEKNNQSPHWGRDSEIPSSCLRFATSTTRLVEPRRGLQILDTRKGFQSPSLNAMLDSINLPPREGPGGSVDKFVLRIPSVSWKGRCDVVLWTTKTTLKPGYLLKIKTLEKKGP